MYLHKENRELFRDAILLASQNDYFAPAAPPIRG